MQLSISTQILKIKKHFPKDDLFFLSFVASTKIFLHLPPKNTVGRFFFYGWKIPVPGGFLLAAEPSTLTAAFISWLCHGDPTRIFSTKKGEKDEKKGKDRRLTKHHFPGYSLGFRFSGEEILVKLIPSSFRLQCQSYDDRITVGVEALSWMVNKKTHLNLCFVCTSVLPVLGTGRFPKLGS